MRIALFVLSLLGLVGLSASQIGFTPVLPNGEMWSARDQAAVELVMKTTTFTDGNTGRQQRLTNYILLYGGQSGNGAQNDVWASQNGRVWYWVAGNAAGVNGDNSHPANPDTFEPMYETFSCQDGNYKQYLAGGRRDGILSSAVYTSIDGIRWDQRTPNAQWEPRYFASMVADSKNNVYMAGGILDDAEIDNKPRRSSQEVWRTTATSGGRDWTRVSAYPDDQTGVSDGPSRRAVSILLSTPQDQLIWLTGVNTGYGPTNNDPYESYLSDAWASGTGGRTLNWGLLTSNASYGRRDDANAEITSGGLIVLAGGYAGTETREVYNDVWASANGGYSWGLCQKESAWDDRRYQMTLLDANGNLWVMGGRDSVGGKLDDLWVSKESFNDANLITTRCKLTVPSCGTGLRCNPGAGTLIAADGTGAYCDSCPYTFSGQASTVTTLTAFLVVFVILTVLALAALGYTFYKLRSAGTPSPIPLPASAQRWWNKSSAGGAAGTTDSAATTNGDGLYQPLRIRDQV